MKVHKGTIMIAAFTAVVAVILFGSQLLNFQEEETLVFNGYEFSSVDNLWRTTWVRDGQPYQLDFRYNPGEVDGIPVAGDVDASFQLEKVYITIDPNTEQSQENAFFAVAAIELSGKLVNPFERNVTAACTRNETDACANRPIVTCSDEDKSVIYLKRSDEPGIILDGNCATFHGSGKDIVKAVDRALFEWLGII